MPNLLDDDQVQDMFWRDIAPLVPKKDVPALREAFNNWTDSLCKSGEISVDLYNSITLSDYEIQVWKQGC